MSELSDEASETELLNRSLTMWHGESQAASPQELDIPLDLHTAASIGQYEVVKDSIERGEKDLDQKNRGGWTPLMYASYIGYDTVVRMLLQAGANVNMSTPEGQTPLMLAASCGNECAAAFLLQQGAELEMTDIHGWTALFHCTSAGHQQMVKFLLDSGANANCREPLCGYSALMEAAASGHEIIVQYLLSHGVKVDIRDSTGATARTLAMKYGHMKIVGLIDLHTAPVPKVLRRGTGKYEDLSSSDESYCAPQRQRPARKSRGPSIHEGPHALAKITAVRTGGKNRLHHEQVPPEGYVTFKDDGSGLEGGGLRYRDVISPINDRDVESSSSREENSFFTNDMGAIKTSSSSEGLARTVGISSEGSLESNEDSDSAAKSSSRKHAKSSMKAKNRYGNSDTHWPWKAKASAQHHGPSNDETPSCAGPQDLATFLDQIGCLKYLQIFEEQDIDLRIFLTLTESDLKEIGITLFGPKRKMTSAIARWHSSARPLNDALELAYADRLEAEMQELAIQLHKRCEEVKGLKGQVSQEQELRAVVESCLMEQDVAWSNAQAQLQEVQGVNRSAGLLLEHMRACQAELASRINQEQTVSQGLEIKAKLGASPEGWSPTLKALSLPELAALLEECVGEMGTTLSSVNRSLERLQRPEKGKAVHKQP
ncbi:ankyrin repeat and SAM domain-containing protein 3 isoform X1 [Thamnophis elegans]|uniref:ankyrin repeat and SAM domain-containing protein 3 isoform X1 n=1 Tax=Thamnophis elegans TaxID=35005 RepID=UPI0013782DA0|nr:ankyrin repeat and SAM domain-containing protein 3 isoform X1 [Thamnophis elegans]XP_032087230.1 ankyrin repeat and SAM domain-containing protein 3 isoform X1 [Thamnophis elegans]